MDEFKMIKINIIGGIFGTSGYDSHTRNLANALYKVADVRLSTQLMPEWEKHVNDAELDMIKKQGKDDDITLIVSTPHTWKLYTGLGKNIGYCVWEGDKVPSNWISDFLNPDIDFIFVPSKHTKQAIWNTLTDSCNMELIKDKIKIIPHGVDRTLFYNQRKKDKDDGSNVSLSGDTKQLQGKNNKEEQMPVNVDNHAEEKSDSSRASNVVANEGSDIAVDIHHDSPSFKFICNKGWRGTNWDRGGVQYVIKAFAEEFSKDEKVELIVKLNPAYMPPQILKQSFDALNLPQDRPLINIRLDNTPFDKLVDLYNEADCYVCATRAEAFNLPGLEAMSCGLPTIQTAYGGQIDYMTDDNSWNIPYNLEKVKEDIMYEGISWATPDINGLKITLRWAFENQDKVKEKGKQAEEDSENWTWDKTAEKIIEVLNEKI